MKTLKNEQFEKFTLEHVVRPYQNIAWPNKERVNGFGCGVDKVTSDEIYEACLFNEAWLKSVCSRIARIYGAIDFSFFPRVAFADAVKNELLRMGTNSGECPQTKITGLTMRRNVLKK